MFHFSNGNCLLSALKYVGGGLGSQMGQETREDFGLLKHVVCIISHFSCSHIEISFYQRIMLEPLVMLLDQITIFSFRTTLIVNLKSWSSWRYIKMEFEWQLWRWPLFNVDWYKSCSCVKITVNSILLLINCFDLSVKLACADRLNSFNKIFFDLNLCGSPNFSINPIHHGCHFLNQRMEHFIIVFS